MLSANYFVTKIIYMKNESTVLVWFLSLVIIFYMDGRRVLIEKD